MAVRFAIVANHDGRIAIDVEAVGRPPRAHERLLRSFLGEIVSAEHPVRHCVDQPSVLAIQRTDRAGLSTPKGGEHVRIHEHQRYDGPAALRRWRNGRPPGGHRVHALGTSETRGRFTKVGQAPGVLCASMPDCYRPMILGRECGQKGAGTKCFEAGSRIVRHGSPRSRRWEARPWHWAQPPRPPAAPVELFASTDVGAHPDAALVPDGICYVTVTADGAHGGSGFDPDGADGGSGATVTAVVSSSRPARC